MTSRKSPTNMWGGGLGRVEAFRDGNVSKKLMSYCESLRSGTPCELSEWFLSTSEHVIKKLTFNDGCQWIVRLPLQRHMEGGSGRFASDWHTRVQSEVATHALIRKQTKIPVPEIHAYDSGQMTIGWPFILMDYIDGYSAEERISKATPEQDSYLIGQMASIQVELANVRLKGIGSVFSKGDGFEVRADVETAKGPFSKPKDYYLAVASQRHKRFADTLPRNYEIASMGLPALLILIIRAGYSPDEDTGDVAEKEYGLANRDLVPRNLLVDENFKIVGMIDLDFVVAAPKHVTATLPNRFASQLDTSSDDLGVAKRTKEYFAALAKAGKPDFETLAKSPFGQLWAELECLDLGAVKEDLRCDLFRQILEMAV